MINIYILITSDVPNHVILGHASFAKQAGFNPVFVFPDRNHGDKYSDYYKEYTVLNTHTVFSNRNLLTYIFSIIAFSFGVFKMLFFKKNVKHILAVDLEGTIASTILKFKGVKVYSLVSDNFSVRYNLNYIIFVLIRFFESALYRLVSNLAIFPDQSRVHLLGKIKPSKIAILPNVLKDTTVTQYKGNLNDNLIVLVCGWLVKTRGVELLKEILEYTDERIVFLLAGSGDSVLIEDLSSSPRVNFIGHLTREKTLLTMSTVDINFAFYNPSIPINRYAMPQKISDSLSIGCPIIINSEVQMADTLFKSGAAYSVGYSDILGISSILNLLINNKQELKLVSERGLMYKEKNTSYEKIKNAGVGMYKELLN